MKICIFAAKKQNDMEERKIVILQETIDLLVEVSRRLKQKKEEKSNRGEYVNVFTLWNEFSGLKEPIHSRILQFLLSSHPMHGQGNRFIQLFLNRIGVDYTDKDEWHSTAEVGKVDIMLKRYHPRSVVIVENKSNWAVDQPNQLYRYWYKNIHQCEEDCKPEYYEENSAYKVIYLVPNKGKTPSDNSLTRPDDSENYPTDLPAILPIKPVMLTFNKDIADWLSDCIKSLHEENTPLINLLTQYKEYCKKL